MMYELKQRENLQFFKGRSHQDEAIWSESRWILWKCCTFHSTMTLQSTVSSLFSASSFVAMSDVLKPAGRLSASSACTPD